MSSGTSALVRCTCSAAGRILSSAKRRKVSATSSKSSERWVGPVPCLTHWSASALEERRIAVLARRTASRRERVGLDAPDRVAARGCRRRDVVHRVGDVRACEHRLDLAVLAVAAHDAGALDGGGRVREVVGERPGARRGGRPRACRCRSRARRGAGPRRRRRRRAGSTARTPRHAAIVVRHARRRYAQADDPALGERVASGR